MSLISVPQAQDGVTAVNAASINGPVNVIADDYNGNITDANIATNAAIAGSKISITSLYNPYKFSAYRNGSQTVTTSTDTRINFDTENFDTSSNYDSTTNYRFTAPISGFYFFTSNVVNNGNGIFLVKLYKNGTAIRYGSDLNIVSNITGGGISELLLLAGGDYIEVWVNSANTSINGLTSGQQLTYFSGFFISAT